MNTGRILASVATLALCHGANAQTTMAWKNAGGGDFTDPANWTWGGTANHAQTNATIALDGGYTVALATNAAVTRLNMNPVYSSTATRDVLFDFSKGGVLKIESGTKMNNMNVTLTGGTLDTGTAAAWDTALLGDSSTDRGGSLTIGAGGTLFTRGPGNRSTLGRNGYNNTLTVKDGGHWRSDGGGMFILGNAATAYGNKLLVTGETSRVVFHNGQFVLGDGGRTNFVTVCGGASFISSNTVVVGAAAGRDNLFKVTGTNTVFDVTTLQMGGTRNTLLIEDGATGTLRSGSHFIGSATDSLDNNLVISNASFTVMAGTFRTGENGRGTKLRAYKSTVNMRTDLNLAYAGTGAWVVMDDKSRLHTLNNVNINSTSNSVLVCNGSTLEFAGSASTIVMSGFYNQLIASNAVIDMTKSTASFQVGPPNGGNSSGHKVLIADSQFLMGSGGWRIGVGAWNHTNNNSTVTITGTNALVTMNAGNFTLGGDTTGMVFNTNKIEILNGAKFICNSGSFNVGTHSAHCNNSALVKGRGSKLTANNSINIGGVNTKFEISEGAVVEIPRGNITLGGSAPASGPDERQLLVDNASLLNVNTNTASGNGNITINAGVFHVRGKCDVVATNQLQIAASATLKCTVDKNGFKPIQCASWNTAAGRMLVVDAREFQRKHGSGWVTLATNTTAIANFDAAKWRFDKINVTLDYEKADKNKHYRENASCIEAYVPAIGGTLFFVK